MIGYIDSSSFPVYTYGEMMIVTPYRIRWTPRNISTGTFTIDGSTYNFSDYSYSGEFLLDKGYITSSAFESNQNITSIYTDVVGINQYAFGYCYNLSQISLPNVTNLGYRAFFSCYALSSVYLPECSVVGGQVFGWCSGLTSISLPKCEYLYNRALYNTAISEIYLPVCSNISSQVFYNCTYLNTISLGSSSVCRLFSSDAFAGTGITSSKGNIVVPESLYESYRTDSVWSYFFNTIKPSNWMSYYIKWDPYVKYGVIRLGRDWIMYGVSDKVEMYGFDGYVYGVSNISSMRSIETNAVEFESRCFSANTSLKSIKLTNPSVTILGSSTAFIYTLITSMSGSIMVPASLLSDYKSAYGWSYFYNRIFPYDESRPYYMSWSPYLTGTFYMNDGTSYLFEDCSGYLSTWTSGMSNSCFKGKEVTRFETNFSSIPEDCFAGCSLLSMISLSKCEIVGDGAFEGGSNLRVINLPECSQVWNGAFADCTQLYSVSLPKCTALYDWAFNGCSSLMYISLPECAYVGSYAFQFCYQLSSIVLPKCNIIESAAFSRTGLQTITLGASSICSLRGSNVFYSTRISGIFVPSNLVEGYKIAPYWSQYSTIIYPINN